MGARLGWGWTLTTSYSLITVSEKALLNRGWKRKARVPGPKCTLTGRNTRTWTLKKLVLRGAGPGWWGSAQLLSALKEAEMEPACSLRLARRLALRCPRIKLIDGCFVPGRGVLAQCQGSHQRSLSSKGFEKWLRWKNGLCSIINYNDGLYL